MSKEWYKDKPARKEICLYELDRLALIILEPSGVFYFNQVGGYSCLQKFNELKPGSQWVKIRITER